MTLDEAIKHAEEVAQANDNVDESELALCDIETIENYKFRCKKCADEHRQLAEWLKDYKRLKEQEPSEDCVSRQAVLEEIPVLWNGKGDKDYCMETLRDFVAELPPVTPTRKVGRWIRKPIRNDKGGCIGAEMICSCCNKDNKHDEYMDYCPNCGAYMQEDAE